MNLLNLKTIKIDFLTIYLLLILFLCGYIKVGLIIISIVLFHELGHVFVAKCLKFKILSVTIYPFGGITKLEKDINTPVKRELMLASAGIFFQILLSIIMVFMPFSFNFKKIFLKYNVSIMIFNMLPIIPLDGSIIINAFLNKFFSFKISYMVHIIISVIGIIFYLLFNYWYSLNNYMIVMLFLLKIISSIKNYKYIYNRFLLERYLKDYDFLYFNTKKGDLSILKLDTYQYFKDNDKVRSEKEKLRYLFDK